MVFGLKYFYIFLFLILHLGELEPTCNPQNRYTLLYNVHKIPVKYSTVHTTHTTHKISVNSADKSSGVVFLTASGFLQYTLRKLMTMGGCLEFYGSRRGCSLNSFYAMVLVEGAA